MTLNAYIPPAKRGPLIVDPKQGYWPNFQFTVADTDLIIDMAKAGRTATEIYERCQQPGCTRFGASIADIKRICWEQHVNVRQI